MEIRDLDGARIIDEPGLYRMPATIYHVDPCVTPSLTQSVASILLAQSPRHAWFAHPRLNPGYQPVAARRLDFGTVAHAILIGRGRDFVEIVADDYRTKAAQAARNEARLAGKTPILTGDLATAHTMAKAAREQLADIQGCEDLFDPAHGDGEVVAVWQLEGTWCRSQIDWLPHNRWVFADYKTTIGSANPDGLGRRVIEQSYDVQAAFYELGLSELDPDIAGRIQPIFIFQECELPYELSVITLDEESMTVGRKKVELAIRTWRRCLEENAWPGYPQHVVPVTIPTWALQSWLDREAREHFAAQDGYDPVSLLRPGAPGGGRLE